MPSQPNYLLQLDYVHSQDFPDPSQLQKAVRCEVTQLKLLPSCTMYRLSIQMPCYNNLMQFRVFQKSLFACFAHTNMKYTKLKSREGKKKYFKNAHNFNSSFSSTCDNVHKSEIEQAFLNLIIPQN